MSRLKFAIVDDDESAAQELRRQLASYYTPDQMVHVAETLMELWGNRLDFVFIDVSCLAPIGIDPAQATRQIGMFMREHPATRVVVTTRLSPEFLRETADDIEAIADRPALFLTSPDHRELVRIIDENTPMHARKP